MTTTSTLQYSIAPFVFGMAVGQAVAIPLTYNWFVFAKDISAAPSAVWRSTSRPDITDAIVIAEGADVTDADMTDEKVDISTQMIARSTLITDEVQQDTFLQEIAQAGAQVSMAVRRKIDAIVMTDTVPNLTNEEGDNSTPMTYAQHVSFGLAARTLWHQNPPPGSVLRCAMHPGPFAALINDMVNSNASIFAATFGGAQVGAVLSTMSAGYIHPIAGIETVVTARMPAGDTTGKINLYALVGNETGTCLGLAVKQGVNPQLRGTEKKLASRGIASARIGAGVLRDEYGLIGITAAA